MDSPFFAVLITDIIFIAFALGLNKKNAKYLLSGYNTMSEKERENSYLLKMKCLLLVKPVITVMMQLLRM